MDCAGRALRNTFLAELALGKIYICNVVNHRNRIVGTDLGALATSYAGSLAGLAGNSALVLIDAAHIYPHSARALVAQFYDILRTGLDTATTAGTLALVHHRESCFGIH